MESAFVSILDSLPLFHSWPLFDAAARMGLDQVEALEGPAQTAMPSNVGIWSCDLANNNALSWSPKVYELFGLPDGEHLTRSLAVSLYAPRSRAAMEHLRAYAIQHRRGFTMDAMIRRANGDTRWMRLSAMPLVSEGKVVRLCGTKQDITADYDGPDWRGI